MKYGKRIIAILLAAVLTMGTLPQAALAEEPTETTAACTEPVETTQIPETRAETAAPETTGSTEESVPETAPTIEPPVPATAPGEMWPLRGRQSGQPPITEATAPKAEPPWPPRWWRG